MKFLCCFVFFLVFAQQTIANELSFYEEFEYGTEISPKDVDEKDIENTIQQKGQIRDNNTIISSAINETEVLDKSVQIAESFKLTDEKHARFLQENEQYALADIMLNLTWKELVKTLNKKQYRALWKEHKKWMETERNKVADSFQKKFSNIPEEYAFMLATVAKTQELAQRVWHSPLTGTYKKDDLEIVLLEENGKFFVQGYGEIRVPSIHAENGSENFVEPVENMPETPLDTSSSYVLNKNEKEKYAVSSQKQNLEKKNNKLSSENLKKDSIQKRQNEKQLLFRAELPKQGKLWLALSSVNEQKFYLLTIGNSLCIVHSPDVFLRDFNGVFTQ